MLTCSSSRHELAPSHEPRLSGGRMWYFCPLILEERYSLQEEGHQYRTESELLQVSVLTLGQLALHIHQKASTPVEYGGGQTCDNVLKLRLGSLMQSLRAGYMRHGEQNCSQNEVIGDCCNLHLTSIGYLCTRIVYLRTRLLVLSAPW